MRKMTLIRCGVVAALAAGGVATGMFAAGCSSDDNGGGGGGSPDSGTDVTQPGDDGSTPDGNITPTGDAGPDAADSGPAPTHGKLILVNGAQAVEPLRFCFGFPVGTSVMLATTNPAPNVAQGVPPGTGGVAADNSVDLATRAITIYGIRASKVADEVADAGTAELNCSQLIGAKAVGTADGGLGLVEGTDYWSLGTLPSGTLADGTTTLVVVTGCGSGATEPAYNCPSVPVAYDGGANLGLWTSKVDHATPLDGGSLGAQFAYASYPFASATYLTAGGMTALAGFYTTTFVVPDAGTDVGDAGDAGDAAAPDAAPPQPVPVTNFQPIAAGVGYGTLTPPVLAPVSGLTFDGTSGFVVTGLSADGGATPVKVPMPLPSIQALSAPGLTTPLFANGAGYVFVLVGDPGQTAQFIGADGGATTQDAGTFNFLSAHILAFPTDPPFGAP
jgi:hypothetical protein